MSVIIICVSIVLMMLIRASIIEVQYYQAIKQEEPQIWQEMGSPKGLNMVWRFIGFNRSPLFQQICSETVLKLAGQHRRTGIQFIATAALVLIASIVFFKMA